MPPHLLGGDGTGLLRTGLWARDGLLAHIGWVFETILLTAAFLCLSWMAHDATGKLATSLFGEAAGDAARSSAEYGDFELGLPKRGEVPARPTSMADVPLGSEHAEKRVTWTSGPRARAGLLVLFLWLGNNLNS